MKIELGKKIRHYIFCVGIAALLFPAIGCKGGKEESAHDELQPFEGVNVEADRRIERIKASLYEDPGNFELLSALGDAYFEASRYEEAIKEYEKALKIKPADADCLNDTGLAYFYLGNNEDALKYVNKAIEADPIYKHSWLSKGFILLSLGKHDEAIPALKQVKELDPGGKLAMEADNFLSQIEAVKGRN